jgi:hypothetical protein
MRRRFDSRTTDYHRAQVNIHLLLPEIASDHSFSIWTMMVFPI